MCRFGLGFAWLAAFCRSLNVISRGPCMSVPACLSSGRIASIRTPRHPLTFESSSPSDMPHRRTASDCNADSSALLVNAMRTNASTKRSLVLLPNDGFHPPSIADGQCNDCRMSRRREFRQRSSAATSSAFGFPQRSAASMTSTATSSETLCVNCPEESVGFRAPLNRYCRWANDIVNRCRLDFSVDVFNVRRLTVGCLRPASGGRSSCVPQIDK